MKTTLLLCALSITAPVFAADASKILLKGQSVSVEEARAEGAASATVGDTTISADVITFDKDKNTLRCEGTVVIRTRSEVVKAKDCSVELPAGEKRLIFLSNGQVRVFPPMDSRFPPMEPLPLSLIPPSK